MSAPDIKVDHNPWAPRHMRYSAVDADSYAADVDDRGFYSRHPMGLGSTYEAAVVDLLEQLEVK